MPYTWTYHPEIIILYCKFTLAGINIMLLIFNLISHNNIAFLYKLSTDTAFLITCARTPSNGEPVNIHKFIQEANFIQLNKVLCYSKM